jgi:hypothetical protein
MNYSGKDKPKAYSVGRSGCVEKFATEVKGDVNAQGVDDRAAGAI